MNWRLRQEVEDALWVAARQELPPGALARKRLLAAITERTRIYTSERDRLGMAAAGGAQDLAARALFFTVADAAKVGVPLAELAGADALPRGRRLRVLDVGAGAGAMTFGLLSFLADRGASPAIDVRAVDQDEGALAIMTAAAEELRRRLPAAARLSLATERVDVERFAPERGEYDIILVGSVLNELSENAASSLLTALVDGLASDGALVVVEPALRETSRHLHRLRDRVLDDGAAVVFAPCVRQGPCPALDDERDWCHDERPLELPELTNQMSVATGLRDGLMKMSYLVLRRQASPLVRAGELVPLRIVSRPRRGKGERDMFVCGDAGRRRLRLLKRHRNDRNRALERARRGDVALVPGERDDPELVDITAGDRAAVVRPAGD